MAFTPKTVGGNIGSDANGVSLLTYQTDDTIADVTTAGYFKSVDANGQLLSGEATADKIFNDLDICTIQCTDGLIQAEMDVTADAVSCVAILTEV